LGNHYTFQGIIPPVVTLFNGNGEIDWQANKDLADWLIGQGVHGILLMGSTGEFSSLTIEERQKFVQEMTSYINKRIPVLIGTGTTSLKDTIRLSQHAEAIGADGVLIVNPYYWNFNEKQLFEYYLTVADSVSVPILIYNIPQLTGQSLSSDLVKNLALSRDNIVGIKDTISDIGHIRDLILTVKEKRPDFAVFSAFDDHLLPALQLGSAGSINGTAIFAPELSVKLYESYRSDHYQEAIVTHQQLIKLMKFYEVSTPFFLGIKEAVNQRVLKKDTGSRAPGFLDSDIHNKVKILLKSNKLL
jgi:4-hydroxy-tetrahydrodipicolinate synthase